MATSRPQPPPLKVFIAYAHQDLGHLDGLRSHLAPLVRERLIEVWHDGDIRPGEDWNEAIRDHLDAADIIVALVSASFIRSYHAYEVELARALKRHDDKAAVLLPIIVRACLWDSLPFAHLQALPAGARPVQEWPNADAAWTDVASGIRGVAVSLRAGAAGPRADRPSREATPAAKRRRMTAIFGVGAGVVAAALAGAAALQRCPATSPCPPGMAYLPAGTFRMGSEDYDREAAADERPAHDVTLTGFCIDLTEVTVARYRRCTREPRGGVLCPPVPVVEQWDGADLKFSARFCNGDRADRDDHPINCVDWGAAATFCKWAGGALPTEAQWEYAARGEQRRRYPWGDDPPGPERLDACGAECRAMGARLGRTLPVLYDGDDGAETTAPVERYPLGATPEGVLGLAGNVAEWVEDTKMAYEPTSARDPVRSAGRLHVLRGGAWDDATPRSVRAAARAALRDDYHLNTVGFRCVHEASR